MPGTRHIAPRRRRDADCIRQVALDAVRPSPENDQIYRPVDASAPDVQALAGSIRQQGVIEPLVITQDGYILSGHRRYVAARLAGLTTVPCRIAAVRRVACDPGEYVRLLREHNRQRVKSLDELLREEVLSADPELAYARLLEHREPKSDMSDFSAGAIALASRRPRKRISPGKQPMLNAVLQVIEERRKFWPLSDRQIHYVLLNDPPLRHARRPDSRYANDRNSYGDLCDLLTRARLTGQVPWQAIADETRPTTRWRVFASPQDFVRKELADLFANYARDLQTTQPNHVEIVAEKLTVRGIVERVAGKYGLPVTIGRGYCSIVPRRELALRFEGSDKERLVLLILSDFDPDGESIAESFCRSLRDDFGIENIVPIKVALTAEQVRELQLVPDMQAKRTSSQYAKFVARHGTDVFELEAIPPDVLQRLLTEAIDRVLHIDLLNAEIEAEAQDAAFLEAARQRACRALRDVDTCGRADE